MPCVGGAIAGFVMKGAVFGLAEVSRMLTQTGCKLTRAAKAEVAGTQGRLRFQPSSGAQVHERV